MNNFENYNWQTPHAADANKSFFLNIVNVIVSGMLFLAVKVYKLPVYISFKAPFC